MGIAPSIAKFIARNAAEYFNFTGDQGVSCLTLGKQSVHIMEHQLQDIICDPTTYASRKCPAHIPGRISDTRDILARDDKLATTIPSRRGTGDISDLFLLMSIGFDTVHSVDASKYEGADIIFDLNEPDLLSVSDGPYDMVIDIGTAEHVFHVPNTLKNIVESTKVGGLVIHISPSNNVIDHGFYQFSPILFYQYYTENGFEPISCKFTREHVNDQFGEPIQFFDYQPNIRGCTVDGSAEATYGLAFCFKKTEKSSSDHIPQQNLYAEEWEGSGKINKRAYKKSLNGNQCASNQKLFLITSNARSGSTLLQTSIARLDEVFTDHEMLLRSSYPSDGAQFLHVFISKGWSCKKFLRELAPQSRFAGSRLILVGFGSHHVDHMEELVGAIEPEIKIINIRRNYFDCMKSSIRGHFDATEENKEIPGLSSSSLIQTSLWSSIQKHKKTIKEIEAVTIDRLTPEQSSMFLVNLFTNDLMLVELSRRADKSMTVDYEDIHDNFFDIASFIGCDTTREECDAIMKAPATKKLPPIPDCIIPDSANMLKLCEMLTQGMKNIIERDIPISDVWTEEGITIPD